MARTREQITEDGIVTPAPHLLLQEITEWTPCLACVRAYQDAVRDVN